MGDEDSLDAPCYAQPKHLIPSDLRTRVLARIHENEVYIDTERLSREYRMDVGESVVQRISPNKLSLSVLPECSVQTVSGFGASA